MWYGNKFKKYRMYWFVLSWVIYVSINSISLKSKVPCSQVSTLIYPENYFQIIDLEICIIFIDALFPIFWNKLLLLIHLNFNCFSHSLVLCFTFLKIILDHLKFISEALECDHPMEKKSKEMWKKKSDQKYRKIIFKKVKQRTR